MRIHNFSIRFNLGALILLASVLSVLLASLGFAIFERQSYRASSVRELTALADTLGANTAASLAFNDQATAKEMLRALATEPHVQISCLYDTQGRIFADYRRRGAPAGIELPSWHKDGANFDSESLTLFRAVLLNGERTGSIALVFDLSDLRSQLFQYAKIAFFVLILSVLLAFLASLRLAGSIGDPLVQLATLARRVSTDKDYSVRAQIRSGGETALLVDSFNQMLSRIESRERALKQALSSLQESEERYALAAQGANDGLWDWNLISGEIYFSPRWNHMLGNSESEHWSGPEDWFSHIHADDRGQVRAAIAAHCEGKTPEFVSEYRMCHKSGGYIWTLSRGVAVRDSSGKAIRMAGSQTDITEGKIADPLTHIPNRLYFIDRLESAIETARQRGGQFAVLFIDLDHFKVVNDSLGHAAGDELLIGVAGRLRASIRNTVRSEGDGQSVVARIGGDEFAILLGQVECESDAAAVAARVLERLGAPFQIEGRNMFVSASIGIALNSTGRNAEELLRNADTAMYRAKVNGKARSEFFNDGMRERVITRFETETGLRKAIVADQLVIHYQPIVSLDDNHIRGFEALVRWNHPQRGLILPSDFISVAEESDLIILLGRWVLRESCRQMAEWQKSPTSAPLIVSVNISSRQLSGSHLVEDVELALAESGLNPQSLALELTESAIMGKGEQALATLDRLKALNVRLEIDDFGTGYSSLSSLQRLPFDALKIDRSFINALSAGDRSLDIVKAVVQLAHSLKLEVIAEGVETEEQLRTMCDLGSDYVQGFLFSRPIGPCAAKLLLREACTSGLRPSPFCTHASASPDGNTRRHSVTVESSTGQEREPRRESRDSGILRCISKDDVVTI
jgi:diguanylate cyclase (GGDEF)-like protein/PAS domain S-box-containing protein